MRARRALIHAVAFCISTPLTCIAQPMQPINTTDDGDFAVSVGAPMRLGELGQVDHVDLAVSSAGTVAAFVPTLQWPGHRGELWSAHRISTDGGRTWTGQFETPHFTENDAPVGGGANPPTGTPVFVESWEHLARPLEFYKTRIVFFQDDFQQWTSELAWAGIAESVFIEKNNDGIGVKTETVNPVASDDQIVKLQDGTCLLAMHGLFKEDTVSRVFLIRSLDGGRLWRTFASVAFAPTAPDSSFENGGGYSDPSLACLANGTLLCIVKVIARDEQTNPSRFMIFRSEDGGVTWNGFEPTGLRQAGQSPNLVAMNNGLLALAYGGPGLCVAFSTDEGETWSNEVQLSDLKVPQITGEIDMVEVEPGRLIAIAGIGEQGTCAFPITVKRGKSSTGE
jgi:hypothetical protein